MLKLFVISRTFLDIREINRQFVYPVANWGSLSSYSVVTCWCRSLHGHPTFHSFEWTVFTSSFVQGAKSSFAIIVSGWSVSTAIIMITGGVTGFLEKMVTNIQNGNCSRALYIPLAVSTLLAGLSVCYHSKAMSLWRKVSTIAWGSVSAEMGNCFATPMVACPCTLRVQGDFDSMAAILDRSLPLPKIDTGAECICRFFCPPTQLSIYVALSTM